jgi:hypothetical protein
MEPYNWQSFVLKIPIQSSFKNIYHAWSTTAGLESWFLRKAAFTQPNGEPRDNNAAIEVNDKYEWLWHGWPDEVVEKGTILAANGTDQVRFSFGKGGNVTVTIKQELDQILVELVQDEIPDNEEGRTYYHIGCMKGWLFYLANLKSILEGGIDLRNRNEALKNVINS